MKKIGPELNYNEKSSGKKFNKLCLSSGNMSEKGMPENTCLYIYIYI